MTPPRTVIANPVINSPFEETRRHFRFSQGATFGAHRGLVVESRGTAPDWAAYYFFAESLPKETDLEAATRSDDR